jgi:hypothetical protein
MMMTMQHGLLTHCIISSLDETRQTPPVPTAHEFASYPLRPLSSNPPLVRLNPRERKREKERKVKKK